MVERPDFAQKLLADLRRRKERMGFATPPSTPPAEGYKNHRQSIHGSGAEATMASNYNNNRKNLPSINGGSLELVPIGETRSQSTVDLSMAIALALSNSGKLQNIEILSNSTKGRKIVLRMGEVAKGAQNLNMILKACSNGFNFNAESIRFGTELLKGAMDLEESLKMLVTLQDASDYMHGSQRLLKGEEEDELKARKGNQWKAGSRSKFSFIREDRSEKKRNPVINSNSNRNLSKSCKISENGWSDLKSGGQDVSFGSHELVRFSNDGVCSVSKANMISEKVRIPNVIAKLMGLEELPLMNERRKTNRREEQWSIQLDVDEDIGKKEVKLVTNSRKKMMAVEEQDKVVQEKRVNGAAKKKFKMSSRSDNKIEARVRKAAELQDEIAITNQQGRKSLPYHTNSVKVRKKNATADREENMQRSKEKIEQINSEVKLEEGRKKELVLMKEELVLKQKRNASVTTVVGLNESQYSKSPKGNLKISSINGKTNLNQYRGKELIEQTSQKRLPLKSDTRENSARTSIQATFMGNPTHTQPVQKLNDTKINKGSAVKGFDQKKIQDSTQSMEQRSSILEELEHRWKKRKKKVKETENCDTEILKLDLLKELQIMNQFDMEMAAKTALCSHQYTGDGNSVQASIEEEINVKFEEENSTSQSSEKSHITMAETQSSLEEDEEEGATDSSMQSNVSKYMLFQEWGIMEEDQLLLSKHEQNLKKILITSQNFLNMAQVLLQINIPVNILQSSENKSPDKDSRVIVDCGEELLRRKGRREEVNLLREGCFVPLKKRSIDTLIKEVNADLESLSFENSIDRFDSDLAEFLKKMIETDIQHRHPDINCMWDLGWDLKTFVWKEENEIVKNLEKYMLNCLLNELVGDLVDGKS